MSRNVKKVTTGKVSLMPATTPEAREMQLAQLAVDLAEKRLRDGTAPAPVIVHYLKIASRREELERQKIEKENELLEARCKSIENATEARELFDEVMKSIREYTGQSDDEEYEDYEGYDDYYE